MTQLIEMKDTQNVGHNRYLQCPSRPIVPIVHEESPVERKLSFRPNPILEVDLIIDTVICIASSGMEVDEFTMYRSGM